MFLIHARLQIVTATNEFNSQFTSNSSTLHFPSEWQCNSKGQAVVLRAPPLC